MMNLIRSARSVRPAVAALVIGLAVTSGAQADEREAKNLLKGMSDYLAAQKTFSLKYDAVFEVVTKEHQKLQLTSSGAVDLSRPDKIRASRSAGFADVELIFDGKTLTIFGKTKNAYAQADVPGTIDNLIDLLRDKYQKPLPAADLLVPNVYDVLMADVTDVKDLGSGVVGGTECDHLAFRAKELDWQIWIAQGDVPYPCRYVITSTQVDRAPEFSIQIHDWKTGSEVAADDFSFKAPADAKKLDVKDLTDVKGGDELPGNFSIGEAE
jgi:hypothetical protein